MSEKPGIAWTFHGTVIVRNYAEAVGKLSRLCGCTPLEFGNAGPPVARLGGCCAFGDNVLEIVEPNDETSPPARYLARFGPGMYNLALQVEDLRQTSAWLSRNGAPPTLPAHLGFTFTRPSETLGLQFEWADLRSAWDPRFGGAIPQSRPPRIHAPRVAFWGALVVDPISAVKRLTQLWRLDLLFARDDAAPDEAAVGISLNDGVLLLYALPTDVDEEARLWGSRLGRARFHAIGMRVGDLAETRRALGEERISILREAPRAVVSDPADTLGVAFVWTDADTPGDPRGPLTAT
ncbi:MAG: VOC family protein [Hyphomonadaceae bacterium]